MASCFCCAVNWRLDLVGLVIDGQSEGHGVTPNDLSTKPGQPHHRNQLVGLLRRAATKTIELVVGCQQDRWAKAEETPLIPPRLV